MEGTPEKTIGAKIPDEDMAEWIKIFYEVTSSDKERDAYLSELNPAFGMQKMSSHAREQFSYALKEVERRLGKQFTEEEKKTFFENLKSNFRHASWVIGVFGVRLQTEFTRSNLVNS